VDIRAHGAWERCMASWVLECVNCNIRPSKKDSIENYFLPAKPVFPDGGQSMSCPHCGHSAMYQASDLRYQP
jgi:hypothetical protein